MSSATALNRPATGAGLSAWLAWQESLHARPIDLGLERVRAVALRLGLLQGVPPSLSVAGTNGKGSSATFASLALRASGRRVGLYTSPHLRRYNERIVLDGQPADDASLVRAFSTVEDARGDTPLTYFEYGTLAALQLFRSAGVDAQVLEVGLGGRLDAVNLVDADVALVTSIGLDHTDWLGPDRESIGMEKAGIFRAGRSAISADPQPPVSLERHARQLGTPLLQLGRDFFIAADGEGYRFGDAGGELWLPRPATPMQAATLAGSIAALRAFDAGLKPEACAQAAQRLIMPGRCQRIGHWVLDVSHNAEAAAVLADFLATQAPGRRWRLVLGMLADKPVQAYCEALRAQLSEVHYASLPGARGLAADELARRAGLPGKLYAGVAQAMAAAAAELDEQEAGIVVCGSFLTVEAALEALE